MIRKLLLGMALPFVNYIPTVSSVGSYPPQTLYLKSSLESKLSEKDVFGLLEKLDGALPSDIDAIKYQMLNLYGQEDSLLNTSLTANNYVQIVSSIKKAAFYGNEYKDAYKQIVESGGLNEVAINDRGLIYTYNPNKDDYKFFEIEDYLNQSEYKALTNSDLLTIRANNPNLAFNNNVLLVVKNGTGMKEVHAYIQDVLDKLGTTEQQNQGFVSSKKVLNGIETFKQAVQESAGDFDPTIQNLYKYKYITKDQSKQIQEALLYIQYTLPENMKTLLKVKTGGDNLKMMALIGTLASSQHKSSIEFELGLEESLYDTSSNNEKSPFSLGPVSLLDAGFAESSVITIQTKSGRDKSLLVITHKMPITDSGGKSIGISTLDKVTESAFAGYLNFENASMGGVMLDTSAFNKVKINGTELHVGYLPIDVEEYNNTGNIKPDFDLLRRYHEVSKKIAQENITDKDTINRMYLEAKLPVMFDGNGNVLSNYMKFGMINGVALESAFSENAQLAEYVTEVTDANEGNSALKIINKSLGKDYEEEWDPDDWGWFEGGTNSLFKGVVFIPVNRNYFTATSGKSISPKSAQMIEAKQQAVDRTLTYVNPGLL